MTPSPALLGELSQSQLLTRWAVASVGVGERRSRAKGSGMEFADHREYQPGDDLRHLDPHLYARFGQNYIRQYEVYQQLPVTILIDASWSMNFGSPNKFNIARRIAAIFGFIGLAGGDQVQIGVGTGAKVHWSPRFHGVMRAQPMFSWLDEQITDSDGTFGAGLRSATRSLVGRGLLIILSDWWEEEIEVDLGILAATGQEVWGVQIAAPEELEPSLLGQGEVRFVDIESGDEIELALDQATADHYRKFVRAWREQIQSALNLSHGRYILMPTDRDPETFMVNECRTRGMLG